MLNLAWLTADGEVASVTPLPFVADDGSDVAPRGDGVVVVGRRLLVEENEVLIAVVLGTDGSTVSELRVPCSSTTADCSHIAGAEGVVGDADGGLVVLRDGTLDRFDPSLNFLWRYAPEDAAPILGAAKGVGEETLVAVTRPGQAPSPPSSARAESLDVSGRLRWALDLEVSEPGTEVFAVSTAVDSAGRTAVCGTEFAEPAATVPTLVVWQLSSSGEVLWRFDGAARSVGVAVSEAETGWVVAGRLEATDTEEERSWVARIDPDGVLAWSIELPGRDPTLASAGSGVHYISTTVFDGTCAGVHVTAVAEDGDILWGVEPDLRG